MCDGVITARPMPAPERAITSNEHREREPGEQPEHAPDRRADDRDRDTRDPVGVVGERDREQEPAELRERDEREVALVGEMERVADVGAEDAERGQVELVRRS